jgi:hypothetical protein
VAGDAVGLLNKQATMRNSIASVEGKWLFAVNDAGVKDMGPRRQVDLGHVPKVFQEPIRGFHDLLRRKPLSLTRATRRSISDNGIVHSPCSENLKSYAVHVVLCCLKDHRNRQSKASEMVRHNVVSGIVVLVPIVC